MKDSPGEAAGPSPTRSTTELIALDWARERPDIDIDNLVLALYLMRLGTVVERTFGTLCEERFGISGPDMRVLFALRRDGKPYSKRPTDLSKVLVVTSGAVTKKVDRLEARALVKRLPDPKHGGGFLVQLTKKGIRMTDEAVEQIASKPPLPGMSNFSQAEIGAAKRFASRVLMASEQVIDSDNDNELAPGSRE